MTKVIKTASNKRKTAVQASPAKQDVDASPDHVQPVRVGSSTARKNAGRTAGQPRQSSKAYEILNLLRRKNGASIPEMQKATGWQSHSVRGFLSGTVKKRMGLTLKSVQPEKGDRRYMVAGARSWLAAPRPRRLWMRLGSKRRSRESLSLSNRSLRDFL